MEKNIRNFRIYTINYKHILKRSISIVRHRLVISFCLSVCLLYSQFIVLFILSSLSYMCEYMCVGLVQNSVALVIKTV